MHRPATSNTIGVTITTSHGPQTPSQVPLLPGINAGRNTMFREPCKQPGEPDYTPVNGDSVRIVNGPRELNHVLATGVWRLMVGDKPVIGLRMRGERGVYALPAFVDGLGVAGTFRVTIEGKPLEAFEHIEATFSPGSARWVCRDGDRTVELEVQHIDEFFGFIATLRGGEGEWHVSGVERVADGEYRHGRFTQILTAAQAPHFICLWGYRDYDRASVEAAYRRLEYRPFPRADWVGTMKARWFHHWIGRGLQPREKLAAAVADLDGVLSRARDFWARQSRRVIVQTPDERFNTAVRHTAAVMINQYEYPAFAHGVDWTKYGKINCGYYGFESAGYQQEAADSLHFIAGTQDLKGRMRYFSPAFALSIWCEEQDFYFVEQVWHHYRWTGDRQFVRDLWPAVRRAIEHGIAASDPNGTGYMTGYYETWNCDTHARGGRCALQTGLAASALRAAARLAAVVDDLGIDGYALDQGAHNQPNNLRTPQQRYERLAERSERALATMWNDRIGAYASADHVGPLRPRPSVMENDYILWRGAGDAKQKYLACRYIRDNYHLRFGDVTMELINDAWPILWSHHYVANGDSCISVLCAALANDIDGFWPSVRSVANTLYTSDTATLTHGLLEDGRGCGMRQIIELEPQFIQAVVDGIFGITPDLQDNRITIRPSLPSDWPTASIEIGLAKYALTRDADKLTVLAVTPEPRRMRFELPVRAAVEAVTVNGVAVEFTTRAEVNCCRVIIETDAGTSFHVEVRTGNADVRSTNEGRFERCTCGNVSWFEYVETSGADVNVSATSVAASFVSVDPDRNLMVDLHRAYNQRLERLYHPSFQWRHDYTGCGVGVDWRDPPPPRDELGYVLMTSPIAQVEYQSLPEGWVCQTYWEVPDLPPVLTTPFGVSFRTGRSNNVAALACTQPYEQLPSEMTIELDSPTAAETLYLLTANLTKTVKCYYPAAEVVVRYGDGGETLHSLVPPHNMPVMVQHICPNAYHIPWGTLHGNADPLTLGGNQPNLAVTQLPLDPTRQVARLTFRCVTTETVLGIVGLTLLHAEGR